MPQLSAAQAQRLPPSRGHKHSTGRQQAGQQQGAGQGHTGAGQAQRAGQHTPGGQGHTGQQGSFGGVGSPSAALAPLAQPPPGAYQPTAWQQRQQGAGCATVWGPRRLGVSLGAGVGLGISLGAGVGLGADRARGAAERLHGSGRW